MSSVTQQLGHPWSWLGTQSRSSLDPLNQSAFSQDAQVMRVHTAVSESPRPSLLSVEKSKKSFAACEIPRMGERLMQVQGIKSGALD